MPAIVMRVGQGVGSVTGRPEGPSASEQPGQGTKYVTNTGALDGMLRELDKLLHQPHQTEQTTGSTLQAPEAVPVPICQNYEQLAFDLTKQLVFCIRDFTQQQVQAEFRRVKSGSASSYVYTPLADNPDCAQALRPWTPFPTHLTETYMTTQQQTGQLRQQLQQNPTNATLLDLARQDLQTGQEFLSHLLTIRVDLLKAFQMVTADALKHVREETQSIQQVHQQAQQNITAAMRQALAGDTFLPTWERLSASYLVWIRTIQDVLPRPLLMSLSTRQFVQACDAQDDDCCLRRVKAMQDEVEKVHTALEMKRNALRVTKDRRHQHATTLGQQIRMLEDDWDLTKRDLQRLQKQLDARSEQQIRDLATRQWPQEPDNLDEEYRALNKRRTDLQQTLQELRQNQDAQADLASYDQISMAADQAQEWKSRLVKFAQRCHTEAAQWENGRGKYVTLLNQAQQETDRALTNLYQQVSRKIDGAGCLLMRYATQLTQYHAQQTRVRFQNLGYQRQRALGHSDQADLHRQYLKLERQSQCLQFMLQTVARLQEALSHFHTWKSQTFPGSSNPVRFDE